MPSLIIKLPPVGRGPHVGKHYYIIVNNPLITQTPTIIFPIHIRIYDKKLIYDLFEKKTQTC